MDDEDERESRFDFVIVGAGSAGCVLANRLSADRNHRVLVLEAGEFDKWSWYGIPVGPPPAIRNARSDWMLKTEPVPGLNGRSLNYPRGKVIGGSSSFHPIIYMRGHAADYDNWRRLGLTGWGWDDVLPAFKQHEHYAFGESNHHGIGGEWRVEHASERWEVLDAFRAAAEQAGIKRIDDFNTGDNEGSSPYHVNQNRGSVARAFLKPVCKRPNLRIETGCLVDQVVFEGMRAVGVRYRQAGTVKVARCDGEVILSAGAIGSAQTLLLSGIGPGAQLQKFGIPIVLDKLGVGENLQDHLQLPMIYKVTGIKTLNEQYASALGRAQIFLDCALRGAPLTPAPSQLGIVTRSHPKREWANIQFHVQPMSFDHHGAPPHTFPAFTASVANLQPTSRGTVRLKSPDPTAAPVIQPNYLATDEDRRVATNSIRMTRRIVLQPAMKPYQPKEYSPGALAPGNDEAILVKAAGGIGTTLFHPVGTAKMGVRSDPMAVVDERLRVFGVERLRVIDASVMPAITSGNTNSPTMMIAERGADMVLEDTYIREMQYQEEIKALIHGRRPAKTVG